MYAKNKRKERQLPVMDLVRDQCKINRTISLEHFEDDQKYLEGTGSIVFDHINRTAFANVSDRSDSDLFNYVCESLGYQGVLFDAFDQDGNPIYHTNIILFIGTEVAVVCSDAICNSKEREYVLGSLRRKGRKFLEISLEQMNGFCGNVLEVLNCEGERVIVMSERAASSFTGSQMEDLSQNAKLVFPPLI